ncbi:MAG TPA: quinoprotein dehydrogenase-associated putative ABC transporter substrate-binding protein [Polyangiaceae bacterium]|nr:quinoprotein dehydrogenase-associated putative ABC transporter substrate-binding protein [Polyangiaceae bacterium]
MGQLRVERKRAALAAIVATAALLTGAIWMSRAAATPRRELRVCADRNNLPFSDDQRAGFENKLAELIAADLKAHLSYFWAPQRRGFIRTTLNEGLCDVVMGVPSGVSALQTSRPYYRSSYVFVFGPGAPLVSSLDDAQLRDLKIGVPLVGEDGANPPPVLALARRGLVANVRGYSVYGDYRSQSPPAELIRALRRRDIDLAIAWGPLAGFYAQRGQPALRVEPLREADAPPGLPFAFDISIGVRKGESRLLADVNRALERQRPRIDALLAQYSVPVAR